MSDLKNASFTLALDVNASRLCVPISLRPLPTRAARARWAKLRRLVSARLALLWRQASDEDDPEHDRWLCPFCETQPREVRLLPCKHVACRACLVNYWAGPHVQGTPCPWGCGAAVGQIVVLAPQPPPARRHKTFDEPPPEAPVHPLDAFLGELGEADAAELFPDDEASAQSFLAKVQAVRARPSATLGEEFVAVAIRGDLEAVRAALAAGADVNLARADGWTALMASCQFWPPARGRARLCTPYPEQSGRPVFGHTPYPGLPAPPQDGHTRTPSGAGRLPYPIHHTPIPQYPNPVHRTPFRVPNTFTRVLMYYVIFISTQIQNSQLP